MTNWTKEPQPFGANRQPLLAGLSALDGVTPVPVAVDPTTGSVLTTGGGGTASSVAINDGTTTSRKATVLGLTDSNPLTVAIVNGTGDQITSFGGGTQYQELVTTSPATGTLFLGRYQTSFPTLTNGQMNEPMLDSSSRLTLGTSAATIGSIANTSFIATQSTPSNLKTQAQLFDPGSGNGASITGAGRLMVDGSGVTQPVTGTVTANIGTTNGLALDASVTGLQVSQGSTTSGQKGDLVQGAVTTTAPTYTTAQTSPLSLTTAGALRTDSSATTQPVSGTITANAGTGTFNIQSNASVNVAQVAGSATSTAATGTQLVGVADGSGNKLTSNSTTYTAKFALDGNLLGTLGTAFSTAGKVDVKGADGDVFVRQATASNLNATVRLQDGSGNAISSTGGSLNVLQQASTATLSNVAGSATSVTLLSANSSRKGAEITNDSSALLYIKFGTTASTTSYTVVLAGSAAAPFSYYEVPAGYTGRIDGIWASAAGNARVTEVT